MARFTLQEHIENVERTLGRAVTVVTYEQQPDGFVMKVSNGNSIFSGSYVVYSYDDGRVVLD